MSHSVLTRSEAAVLTAVAEQGQVSQLEIPRLASLSLSETRRALGQLRERHLLEQHPIRPGQNENGATVYFMPTRSGVETAGLLRRSAGSVLSHDTLDDPSEDQLDSALETALAGLE